MTSNDCLTCTRMVTLMRLFNCSKGSVSLCIILFANFLTALLSKITF